MASEDNEDSLLSPVPEFSITHHDRDEPEKRLPEFDEQDYQSKSNSVKYLIVLFVDILKSIFSLKYYCTVC